MHLRQTNTCNISSFPNYRTTETLQSPGQLCPTCAFCRIITFAALETACPCNCLWIILCLSSLHGVSCNCLCIILCLPSLNVVSCWGHHQPHPRYVLLCLLMTICSRPVAHLRTYWANWMSFSVPINPLMSTPSEILQQAHFLAVVHHAPGGMSTTNTKETCTIFDLAKFLNKLIRHESLNSKLTMLDYALGINSSLCW